MAINFYTDKIEIFKFPETGWFALFEEVLEFRKDEAKHGKEYDVIYVGLNKWGHFSVCLQERVDDTEPVW